MDDDDNDYLEGFRPVSVGSQTDLELLPRRFDAFVNEFRFSFELLANKILPKLDRIEEALRDTTERVTLLEHGQRDHARRLEALEDAARISALRPRTARK